MQRDIALEDLLIKRIYNLRFKIENLATVIIAIDLFVTPLYSLPGARSRNMSIKRNEMVKVYQLSDHAVSIRETYRKRNTVMH